MLTVCRCAHSHKWTASCTLDEAPMAYKGMDEIISQIGPAVQIVERIAPVYNFKAAE